MLIKFGAEKLRIDRLGRTPLHLAAYAGHAKEVAILLDFPEGEAANVVEKLHHIVIHTADPRYPSRYPWWYRGSFKIKRYSC